MCDDREEDHRWHWQCWCWLCHHLATTGLTVCMTTHFRTICLEMCGNLALWVLSIPSQLFCFSMWPPSYALGLLFLKSVFGGLPYNSCGQCYEMYTWACHDVYDKEIMRWEGVCGYSGHWVLEHPSGMCFYSQTPQSRAYVTMLQGKRALKKKEIDKQQGK